MKKLVIMCGCPGSGKSTLILERYIKLNLTTVTVSRDQIRFSILNDCDDYFAKEKVVFRKYCAQLNEAMANGVDIVIADATQINAKSRKKLFDNLNIPEDYFVEAMCLETPLNECIKRNEQREGRAYVPESAIREMYEKYERPTIAEGFDVVIIHADNFKITQAKGVK